MTMGKRYTHTIFIDYGPIYSEWGALIVFSFYKGGFA